MPRCNSCSEPTGKLCSRRAARRGGVNGRRPRGRPAVMLMRAPKARHGPAARGYASPSAASAPHSKVAADAFARKKTAGTARRGAASSSIRVGTWKLNCRLPGRGGNGDEIKCCEACSEMASVQSGAVGCCVLVGVKSTHSFKGPTDSCRSTTFQEPPAPGVRWWLPLVLQQQQLGNGYGTNYCCVVRVRNGERGHQLLHRQTVCMDMETCRCS